MNGERIGIGTVWILSLVGSLLGLLVAPAGATHTWLALTFGGCVLATFAIQLAGGRASGYLVRAMMSIVGAMIVVAVSGLIAVLAGR